MMAVPGGLHSTRSLKLKSCQEVLRGLFLCSAVVLLGIGFSRRVRLEGDFSWRAWMYGRCGAATVNVLLCIEKSGHMPQRPGAFAAQFAPETLQRFRELCRQQDKAYSKVLERLALLYVETDGGILSTAGSASAPSKGVQKRQVQVESLQNKLLEDLLKRVEILEKKETKLLYELDHVHKELAFFKSGLKAPEY